MAAGLAGTYAVLSLTGLSIGAWDIAAPTLAGGIGMGMVAVVIQSRRRACRALYTDHDPIRFDVR